MRIIFTSIIIICQFTNVSAQLPDSLQRHLDSAIHIMKAHSYYASRIDWPTATVEANALATTATNKETLFPAIAHLYKQLNDHHGWFEQYNDKIKLTDSSAFKRYSDNLKKEWGKGPKIMAVMLGDIAYIRMPGMPVNRQQQIDQYANWLADSIVSLAKDKPAGWIIDLRLNTGGNIVPMMSGLTSFFKEGELAGYLNNQKKIVGRSFIRQQRFYVVDGEESSANVKQVLPDLSTDKVAVIIGPGTSSSGEGVAINFLHFRNHSRLFGEQSGGFANSTEGFVFNNDQSYFLLTTSMISDPNHQPLPEIVTPQTIVQHNDLFDNLPNDVAVIAALKWLH